MEIIHPNRVQMTVEDVYNNVDKSRGVYIFQRELHELGDDPWRKIENIDMILSGKEKNKYELWIQISENKPLNNSLKIQIVPASTILFVEK